MPPFVPCPSCAEHIAVDSCVCPHCGDRLRYCASGSVGRTAAAALLGLTMTTSGCFVSQSKYDVPFTGTPSEAPSPTPTAEEAVDGDEEPPQDVEKDEG